MRAGSTYYYLNTSIIHFGKRLIYIKDLQVVSPRELCEVSVEGNEILPEVKYSAIKEWQKIAGGKNGE